MPSRGTMGIRMSRIRVDDVLNIATLRAYPSNTVRFLDNSTPMSTNSLVYVKIAEITLPVEYQYPSVVRVGATIGVSNDTGSIEIRVANNSGLGYETIYTNPNPGYVYQTLKWDVDGLGVGGNFANNKISWWLKSGAGSLITMPNISVSCGNESVIDGKNPGTW